MDIFDAMVEEGGTTYAPYKRYHYCRMEHGKISSSIPRDNYTVQILEDQLHRFYQEAAFFAPYLFRSGGDVFPYLRWVIPPTGKLDDDRLPGDRLMLSWYPPSKRV